MVLKFKIILKVLIIFIVTGFVVMAVGFSYPVTNTELDNRFIVSNPLNLSQIAAFSKYRSCAGHDYRGPVAGTGKKEDTPRSMKYYIKVKPDLSGKNGIVEVRAPFDGKIYGIYDDFGGPGDQQIWLTPESISPRQWHFVLFHIALAKNLKEGSLIKAGQLIGTANLTRGPENKTDNFDMAVKFTRPLRRPAIDAPFSHMAKDILDEYAQYGITEFNTVISKERRDLELCPTIPKPVWGDGDDVYFSPQWSPDDIIWLK